MSVENIVTEIQNEGKKIAIQIHGEYKEKAHILKQELDEKYNDIKSIELKAVAKELEENYQGKLLAAKIENQKELLRVKKEIIDTLLIEVQKSFKNLVGKDKYLSFIQNCLSQYAENGDNIYLSSEDMKESKELLLSKTDKTLTFIEGALEGGVMIEKKDFNYNFSIQSLLSENYLAIEKLIGKEIHVLR